MEIRFKNKKIVIELGYDEYDDIEVFRDYLRKKIEKIKSANKDCTNTDYISNITAEINKNIKEDEKKMNLAICTTKETAIKAMKDAVKQRKDKELNNKIVKLRDFDGLSFAKIGKMVELTGPTVKRRYEQMKGDSDGGSET